MFLGRKTLCCFCHCDCKLGEIEAEKVKEGEAEAAAAAGFSLGHASRSFQNLLPICLWCKCCTDLVNAHTNTNTHTVGFSPRLKGSANLSQTMPKHELRR